jgi:hypothetical protein
VHTLEETGEAALKIHRNEHEGKIGILCLAPGEGLGIDDPEKRERIGEDRSRRSAATAAETRAEKRPKTAKGPDPEGPALSQSHL